MDLADAERWPMLMQIVGETVKLERQDLRDTADYRVYKRDWWKYAKVRNALYAALAPLDHCLACSQVTKHLAWSRQPADRTFSHTAVVIPSQDHGCLALLQSRPHERWARALGSSMETRLRYTPRDCFQTFPFPCPDPRTPHPALDALGERLELLRGAFMLAHQVGLTTTYNLLLGFKLESIGSDPNHKHHGPATDPRLAELRELHRCLDRAVLDTYAACLAQRSDPRERELAQRFLAIEVPAYVDPRLPELSPSQRRTLDTFNDALLDALMALNEVRAAQERRQQ